MQQHEFAFEVEASPRRIWSLFWGRRQRVIRHGDVRIEYLHWGDEVGEGRIVSASFASLATSSPAESAGRGSG